MRDTFTLSLTPHKQIDPKKGEKQPEKADLSLVVHNIESLDQNGDHCLIGMASGKVHAVQEARSLIIDRLKGKNILVPV